MFGLETMRTFFALATIVANLMTVGIAILAIVYRRSETNPFASLRGSTLWLAGGVAAFATIGSLYLSESAGLTPCTLCWYQRIAMYPLAVILPMAAFRNDSMVRPYVATLALIGGGIALYHRTLQAFPSLDSGACSAVGPSCSTPLINEFGFVTIPTMALSAFLLILAFLWVDRFNSARAVPTLDRPHDVDEPVGA